MNSQLLVLDLGHLLLKSKPSAKEDFYDHFNLELSNLKGILAANSDNWRSPEVQKERNLTLLENFSIILNMDLCKVDSENYTKVMYVSTILFLSFFHTPFPTTNPLPPQFERISPFVEFHSFARKRTKTPPHCEGL
jgi:hypothetical protein